MKAKTQKKSKTSKSKKSVETPASSGSRDAAGVVKPSVQKASRTSTKKPQDKKGGSDSGGSGIVSKSIQFVREAKTELKKVKWPTKKELLASTAVVIVLSLLVAFYLGLIDFGLIKIIKLIVG
ncbi:MAG: preprotein translocase subunit SecE [Desulfatiglandaceae bacterium]